VFIKWASFFKGYDEVSVIAFKFVPLHNVGIFSAHIEFIFSIELFFHTAKRFTEATELNE